MIFISGGGNYQQTRLLDALFFEQSNRILYIPIGLKRNFSGYEGCWEWFSQVCYRHKFNPCDVDMYLFLENLVEINQYGGIYIGGASDIMSFNRLIIKSGFSDKLKSYLRFGGNIYGGSAAGILLGQSLDLQNKEGLGLLPFSILPHYSSVDNYKIDLYFQSNSCSLIVLREDSGIIYDGKKIKSVGFTVARIYFTKTNFVELKNNDSMAII